MPLAAAGTAAVRAAAGSPGAMIDAALTSCTSRTNDVDRYSVGGMDCGWHSEWEMERRGAGRKRGR